MTTNELKQSLAHRWKAWLATGGASGALALGALTWADDRWDQRKDITEIKDSVQFLECLMLKERITQLDGRVQILEMMRERSRDERRTLNELRLERGQLLGRIERLEDCK